MQSSLVYTQGGKIRPVHDSIGNFLVGRQLSGLDYETLDNYFLKPLDSIYKFEGRTFDNSKSNVLWDVLDHSPDYANHLMSEILDEYYHAAKVNSKLYGSKHNLILKNVSEMYKAVGNGMNQNINLEVISLVKNYQFNLFSQVFESGEFQDWNSAKLNFLEWSLSLKLVSDLVDLIQSYKKGYIYNGSLSGEQNSGQPKSRLTPDWRPFELDNVFLEDFYSRPTPREMLDESITNLDNGLLDKVWASVLVTFIQDYYDSFDVEQLMRGDAFGQQVAAIIWTVTNKKTEYYHIIRNKVKTEEDSSKKNYLQGVLSDYATQDYFVSDMQPDQIIKYVMERVMDFGRKNTKLVFELTEATEYLLKLHPNHISKLLLQLSDEKAFSLRTNYVYSILSKGGWRDTPLEQKIMESNPSRINQIINSQIYPSIGDVEYSLEQMKLGHKEFGQVVMLAHLQGVA